MELLGRPGHRPGIHPRLALLLLFGAFLALMIFDAGVGEPTWAADSASPSATNPSASPGAASASPSARAGTLVPVETPAATTSPTPASTPLTDLPGLNGKDKREVTVVVKPIEPFVFGDPAAKEAPTGFSVDLWNAIASRAGWRTNWVWTDTVTNEIHAVADRKADAAIGAITMTPEREAVIDFSLRVFSSNLGIVTATGDHGTSSFLSVIFSPQVGKAVRVILIAIALFAVIIFFARRRQPDFPRGIVRGLGNSLWLSGQAVMGKSFNNVFTGGKDPSRFFSRVLFLIWLWIAILIAGYIGGSITSVMTVKQLKAGIAGPQDLVNYTVIAPEGTTSDTYLTDQGIGHDVVPTYQEGLAALAGHKYDAMVFDRPVLQYYINQHPNSGLSLVDSAFGAEPYGFALQQDSDLRQQVNLALLAVNTDGTYNDIYSRWFGGQAEDSAG